jgi:hypothetical protein
VFQVDFHVLEEHFEYIQRSLRRFNKTKKKITTSTKKPSQLSSCVVMVKMGRGSFRKRLMANCTAPALCLKLTVVPLKAYTQLPTGSKDRATTLAGTVPSRVELIYYTFVLTATITAFFCHLRFIGGAIPKKSPIVEVAKLTGDYWATATLF